MALDPASLGGIAATISAMIDVWRIGKESFQDYFNLREKDPSLASKESTLEKAFSTYSQEELRAIKKRIDECKARFIKEGSGEQRRSCICSVLKDVRDGNGGTIPDPEWEAAFHQLRCSG